MRSHQASTRESSHHGHSSLLDSSCSRANSHKALDESIHRCQSGLIFSSKREETLPHTILPVCGYLEACPFGNLLSSKAGVSPSSSHWSHLRSHFSHQISLVSLFFWRVCFGGTEFPISCLEMLLVFGYRGLLVCGVVA